ncbi:MAG: hypothetical protein WCI64_00020 [Chlorobium sp.]
MKTELKLLRCLPAEMKLPASSTAVSGYNRDFVKFHRKRLVMQPLENRERWRKKTRKTSLLSISTTIIITSYRKAQKRMASTQPEKNIALTCLIKKKSVSQ